MARAGIARRGVVAALALAALPADVLAADAERRRHPLVPDQARLQLAGAIGLLSAGAGYAFADTRLELDVLVGWAPASIADVDLVTLTGKVTYLPWRVRLPRGWRLRPLTAAFAITHTFGGRFHLRTPSKYPSGYLPVPTSLRGTVALGGTIGRPVGRLKELALSVELVAVDVPLAYWIRNSRAVDASDVISVALGVRAEF